MTGSASFPERVPVVRRDSDSSLPVQPLLTPNEEPVIIDLTDADREPLVGISSTGYPTSSRSRAGYTMDSYLIANTQSAPLRAFYYAGILNPTFENTTENDIIVTDYFAEFTDRDRTLAITEETYRAMTEGVEPHNEEPTTAGMERIQTSMKPISADRRSSQETARDGHGRTRPYRDDTRFPASTPTQES